MSVGNGATSPSPPGPGRRPRVRSRSTPNGSLGSPIRAWSNWSRPSTRESSWTRRSIYGVDLYADLAEALSAVGPVDVVVIAAPLGEHFRLAQHRAHLGRGCLSGEASGDLPGRLHPAARARAGDRAGGPGRFPEPRFAGTGDASSGRLRHRPGGQGRRRGRLVANGRLLDPLALVRPPEPARPGRCRRRRHESAGPRGGHGPGDRRLPQAGGRRGGGDRSLPRQRHRQRRHVGGSDPHHPGARGDLRPHACARRSSGSRRCTSRAPTAAPPSPTPPTGSRSRRMARPGRRSPARTDLVENLLAHRRDGSPLLVPLASTGAFMRVLAAVADADEPIRIDPRAIRWEGEGQDRRAIVDDVEHWLAQGRIDRPDLHRTRGALGAPRNATACSSGPDFDGVEVARLPRRARHHSHLESAPGICIPYARWPGSVLSARHPADHDWHNGVGMAIPDVNGTSFWGGGTYVHGAGLCAARQPRRDRRRGTRGAGRRVHPAS